MAKLTVRIIPCLAWLCAAGLAQQNQAEQPAPPQSEEAHDFATLGEQLAALRAAEQDLTAVKAELKKAVTDEQIADIKKRINTQDDRVKQLRDNFRMIAAGVVLPSDGEKEPATTLDADLKEVLSPMFQEMRRLTSKPREMEDMRNQLSHWTHRRHVATAALERLGKLISAKPPDAVAKELKETMKLWTATRAEADSKIDALSSQIAIAEKHTPSLFGEVSRLFTMFWRSRGLNLLIALAAMIGTWVLTRKCYLWLLRLSPIHMKRPGSFGSRVLDLTAVGLAFVSAVLAALVVFYVRGDWMLLTLSAILLFGLLWASRSSVPHHIEQIKVLLNLGAVRHGERVVYRGLPWRVESLGVYCDIKNVTLCGGTVRLPLREMIQLVSRPSAEDETWFPTSQDDWVRLADGTYGKVVRQTPEHVVVLQHGGSRKTYPTTDFLAQRPENLSHGFRVRAVIGIGYQHLAEFDGRIPEILQTSIMQALVAEVGHDNIRSVQVELSEPAASSLDYAILADFSGEVASRYTMLERLVRRAAVAACHRENWSLPYPQMTIHQGEPVL